MKFVRETFLSIGGIALCLGALEGGLQVYQARQRAKAARSIAGDTGPPLHVVVDSPELYGLNPAHPEISTQGLRDDEVAIPKPPGLWRILILGDSITYGMDGSVDSWHLSARGHELTAELMSVVLQRLR